MSILRRIFETLREYYAAKPDCPWWPENPVEATIGAILVAGSTWKTVKKVLDVFRTRGLIDFNKIIQLKDEELFELIRPVGFQARRVRCIKAVSKLILERSQGDLDRFFSRDTETIRQELLSIDGIGSGTADNILLYAGHLAVYMVDPFTTRILIRHGIVHVYAIERQIQKLIHQELTPDEEPYGATLFQKMQEYLVRLGRDFCDKSHPNCLHCPLHRYLPEGGAVDVPSQPVGKVPHKATSKKAVQPKTIPPASPPFAAVPAAQTIPAPLSSISAISIPSPSVSSFSVSVSSVPASPHVQSTHVQKTSLSDLDATERIIAEAISTEPMPIDSVVQAVQLPVHIVRGTIAVLQMKKIVCQVAGNQVKRLD